MSRRSRGHSPDGGDAPSETAPAERLRLDVWLWRARFFKTRALAAAAVEGGKIRVNRERVRKPGSGLKLGDVLTFSRAGAVRVVEIRAFGARRGPATEARALYHDLAPVAPTDAGEGAGAGPATGSAAPMRPLDAGDDLA